MAAPITQLTGGSDTLRAIYPQEHGSDGVLKAGAGDTWTALVEWDENGQLSADVVHQFGSATRNKNSPHFSDQVEFFATKKWRSALRKKVMQSVFITLCSHNHLTTTGLRSTQYQFSQTRRYLGPYNELSLP